MRRRRFESMSLYRTALGGETKEKPLPDLHGKQLPRLLSELPARPRYPPRGSIVVTAVPITSRVVVEHVEVVYPTLARSPGMP